MNQPYINRVTQQFISQGFQPVSVYNPITSYIKQEGGQVYLVHLLDISMYSKQQWQEVDRQLQEYSNHYLNSLSIQRKMVLNVFIGNQQVMELYTQYEHRFMDYNSSYLPIYWFVDIVTATIRVPHQMPDQLIKIENYLKMSFQYSNMANHKPPLIKKTNKIPVTYSLIGANVLLWIAFVVFFDSDFILTSMGLNTIRFFHGYEFWRLFTSMFTHLSITHLGYNMLSLIIFGSRLEKYTGHGKFLFIYITSGLVAGLASVVFNYVALPTIMQVNTFGIGASGAIFGIIGSALAVSRTTGRDLEDLSAFVIAAMAGIGIFMGFVNTETNVDNMAHLGGFISGYLITKMLLKQNIKH